MWFTRLSPEAHDHEYEVLKNFKHEKPKNIVISFDGTGGEPGWGVQSDNVDLFAELGGLGNCCKMHLYAGGNIGNDHHTFTDQLPLYYSGVGTRGHFKLLKSAMGLGAMHDIYGMAYDDLKKIYNKGDKLFVFGFSRGASTARLFCSFLSKEVNQIKGVTPTVAFLGVFDTVCESFPIGGGVGVSDDPKVLDVDGKDGNLPFNVERAVHLVSIDDYRGPFTPTLFNHDERVTEVWCPGVHSDIGGGYYHDGLSDIALHLMIVEAKKCGLLTRPITEDTCKNDHDSLVSPGANPHLDEEAFAAFDKDMKLEPDALDPDIHNTMSFPYQCFNFLKGFNHRHPRRMKEDKVWDEPILLLDAAVERVKKYNTEIPATYTAPDMVYSGNKYRPVCLLGKKYKLVSSKDFSIGDKVFDGIENEVEW